MRKPWNKTELKAAAKQAKLVDERKCTITEASVFLEKKTKRSVGSCILKLKAALSRDYGWHYTTQYYHSSYNTNSVLGLHKGSKMRLE